VLRTQISLTEAQLRAAQEEARRRGISLAALIREAVDRLLAADGDRRIRERARRGVGGFRSGHRSTSERHDEVLAEPPRW
jgi:hypothetical protein